MYSVITLQKLEKVAVDVLPDLHSMRHPINVFHIHTVQHYHMLKNVTIT